MAQGSVLTHFVWIIVQPPEAHFVTVFVVILLQVIGFGGLEINRQPQSFVLAIGGKLAALLRRPSVPSSERHPTCFHEFDVNQLVCFNEGSFTKLLFCGIISRFPLVTLAQLPPQAGGNHTGEIMHTWIISADGVTYSVGHYRLSGGAQHSSTWEWVEMMTFTTQAEADSMVCYLNGGAAPTVKK